MYMLFAMQIPQCVIGNVDRILKLLLLLGLFEHLKYTITYNIFI